MNFRKINRVQHINICLNMYLSDPKVSFSVVTAALGNKWRCIKTAALLVLAQPVQLDSDQFDIEEDKHVDRPLDERMWRTHNAFFICMHAKKNMEKHIIQVKFSKEIFE